MNIINLIAKTLLEISLAGNVFFQPFPPVFNKVDIEAFGQKSVVHLDIRSVEY